MGTTESAFSCLGQPPLRDFRGHPIPLPQSVPHSFYTLNLLPHYLYPRTTTCRGRFFGRCSVPTRRRPHVSHTRRIWARPPRSRAHKWAAHTPTGHRTRRNTNNRQIPRMDGYHTAAPRGIYLPLNSDRVTTHITIEHSQTGSERVRTGSTTPLSAPPRCIFSTCVFRRSTGE